MAIVSLEEQQMKKILQMCFMISFFAASSTFAEDWNSRSPGANQVLVTGTFYCRVITIEPPNGPGVPEGYASVDFNQTLGMVGGDVSTYVELGIDGDLIGACQQLTDSIQSLAQGQRCATGPVTMAQYQGGNFFEETWRFPILCSANQTQVVGSVSKIVADLMTTPTAGQQVIQRRSDEMLDGSSLSHGPELGR